METETKQESPPTFAEDGLIQLHWQNNLSNPSTGETVMVAQGGPFTWPDEMQAWIRQTIADKKDTCPEGWSPMVCDSTSEYFWLEKKE